MMIAIILALTLIEFSQVSAALVAVIAGLAAAIRFIVKKYTKNLAAKTTAHPTVVELKENQKILTDSAEAHTSKLDEVISGLDEFKEGLDTHMDKEEKVRKKEYVVIQAIQKKLDEGSKTNKDDHTAIFTYLDKMKDGQVEQALNVVKSMAIGDKVPTLLYKTSPGEYKLIWHNNAWTEWTGLDMDDSRAGGDILSVHPDDRPTIEPSVEETGQLKEEVDVHYMLVRPKTGEKVGRVWAHGYPIHTADEAAWYYVSRIRMVEPEPGFEGFM
jgi:hypothetical protein